MCNSNLRAFLIVAMMILAASAASAQTTRFLLLLAKPTVNCGTGVIDFSTGCAPLFGALG